MPHDAAATRPSRRGTASKPVGFASPPRDGFAFFADTNHTGADLSEQLLHTLPRAEERGHRGFGSCVAINPCCVARGRLYVFLDSW